MCGKNDHLSFAQCLAESFKDPWNQTWIMNNVTPLSVNNGKELTGFVCHYYISHPFARVSQEVA